MKKTTDQVTLGVLRDLLYKIPARAVIEDGFAFPHPYIADNTKVCFEPVKNISVSLMRQAVNKVLEDGCREITGNVFCFDAGTPVWIAYNSNEGEPLLLGELCVALFA
jgi:hypothetical protein